MDSQIVRAHIRHSELGQQRLLNLLGEQHRKRGENALSATVEAQISQEARRRERDPALGFFPAEGFS
jgi:hypothetical protein